MASVNACAAWANDYPISTQHCLGKFPDKSSFQLGYIGSLAAVPFGKGTSGAKFSNRQRIAQMAWVLIFAALVFGILRKRSFRYAERSNSLQWIMEPFALVSKLLAVAFASLFGILIGDLNPNSNLLEVLVWITPGLLYHRFSPELVQDNCLAGLLINTVTYLPGLITAAFSIWSAVDFSALVPQEAWGDYPFLRASNISLGIRVLATITVVVAILRQMLGAYTNLVLSARRRMLNEQLDNLKRQAGDVARDDGAGDELQKKQEAATLELYMCCGVPQPCVDLDWIAMVPHAVLVLVELITFVLMGVAIIMTANIVRDRTNCLGRKTIGKTTLPVPSFFTLQQAVACPEVPCEGFEIHEPFCHLASFNIAVLVGSTSIILPSLSLLWLLCQWRFVDMNHKYEQPRALIACGS